ncbi:MAG: NAD(P)/FAD-dependent oxidoreductase [Anaerolineae bacterium]|jgi:phytoene dehydrogenase-like protein|nr:NAD(P)/FAD-dependent oxidoreductase [Anaerolineae bacterium]
MTVATTGARDLKGAGYDAVVVGSGPNGLAAAITLARAGRKVLVLEGKDKIGGGLRSADDLTLPGFIHDPCSAMHPLGIGSPFFRSLDQKAIGLRWVFPPAAMAHPHDDGTASLVRGRVETTASQFGRDERAYRMLMGPLVDGWKEILAEFLGPLRVPRHPIAMARFGVFALMPAAVLARTLFREERTRAVFAGLAAHSIMPLEKPATAAFGLMLGMLAHALGWPMAERGSQTIANALAAQLRALGGEIVTGREVRALEELAGARQVLLDVTPRQLLQIAGEKLPDGYRRQLEAYRYGAGVFKVDYALDGPIPWRARECLEAGTVHVGGALDDIAASEAAMGRGEHSAQPFVLVGQQSLFDRTRAPEGKHTVWAYCHVPNGSTVDMTAAIEDQIERFAPGFRGRILARATRNSLEMERYNPNYIGGDINGGVQDLGQLFTRPAPKLDPYATPLPGVFLCSSATPPGGGVHGMCGYFAAQSALKASNR